MSSEGYGHALVETRADRCDSSSASGPCPGRSGCWWEPSRRRLVADAKAGARPPPEARWPVWAHWDGAWYLDSPPAGTRGRATRARRSIPHIRWPCASSRWRSPRAGRGRVSSLALLVALVALRSVAAAEAGRARRALVGARAGVLPDLVLPRRGLHRGVVPGLRARRVVGGARPARCRARGAARRGAALTRNVGVVLVVPLLLEWRRQGGRFVVAPGGGAAGPRARARRLRAYLGATFGDPALLVTAAQGVWDRSLSFPVATVVDSVRAANGAWPRCRRCSPGTGTSRRRREPPVEPRRARPRRRAALGRAPYRPRRADGVRRRRRRAARSSPPPRACCCGARPATSSRRSRSSSRSARSSRPPPDRPGVAPRERRARRGPLRALRHLEVGRVSVDVEIVVPVHDEAATLEANISAHHLARSPP